MLIITRTLGPSLPFFLFCASWFDLYLVYSFLEKTWNRSVKIKYRDKEIRIIRRKVLKFLERFTRWLVTIIMKFTRIITGTTSKGTQFRENRRLMDLLYPPLPYPSSIVKETVVNYGFGRVYTRTKRKCARRNSRKRSIEGRERERGRLNESIRPTSRQAFV